MNYAITIPPHRRGDNYGERSYHQFGFNMSVGLGRWRSGLHLRLPLDEDLKRMLDAVFGAQLGVQL